MKKIPWLGVTTTWGTELKCRSIRKVENQCLRWIQREAFPLNCAIPVLLDRFDNSPKTAIMALMTGSSVGYREEAACFLKYSAA